MKLVIDASAAVQASLSEAGFELLATHDLKAPDLLWSEVISALHEMGWRGTISPELARLARERFKEAPVQRHKPEDAIDSAWEIADALGWAKTYDAEYVTVARELQVPLLTIDARLARAVQHLIEVADLKNL